MRFPAMASSARQPPAGSPPSPLLPPSTPLVPAAITSPIRLVYCSLEFSTQHASFDQFLLPCAARACILQWPRGLLLYGPPGTGKTSLVQAIVRECNAHLTMIKPYSVHKPHAGEGERFLREAFAEAYSKASQGRPAIIFIDELDAICP
ncbi:cell division control protein 48 homolog B-like [Lolium rigidum]|uniref:cell division control protein 48 homolog B-like n=1 Tax=Lolium rigidum TaxID=89674 RepID=UPI001F5CA864|nr:cell division control protein 48 homolog B-like [Lolium rigidum]